MRAVFDLIFAGVCNQYNNYIRVMATRTFEIVSNIYM